jgi:hypothetical protein
MLTMDLVLTESDFRGSAFDNVLHPQDLSQRPMGCGLCDTGNELTDQL